jgi:nucleotide-binding universal stress UspA family protein
MFKRVLLCYDSTEAGRRALRRGAELAILLGAQVYVLSIVPNPQPSGGFWWSGASRVSLAERAKCCIFVAVNSSDEPASVSK